MSKHVKHVPKHRAAPSRPALAETGRRAVGATVLASSVAVVATGATVGGGVLTGASASVATTLDAQLVGAGESTPDAADLAAAQAIEEATRTGGDAAPALGARAAGDREALRRTTVSRSADRRETRDPVKAATLVEPVGKAEAGSEDLSDADPRDIAMALLGEFGFSSDQFGCLDSLYVRESGWNVYADNPTSSAYGIPQALPGSKMSSAGADWATNPVTQIRWGLGYIRDRYGSPCGAWAHSESVGWY
ncbi:transglycosylase SLT domain-containing protein [Nocardioides marinquilinus]|uniref:Transglycosylase SLT domain-containing protein n=1 Tax=Nocardioides marinquilinus TaxID=1210400 RepID=A0ABP9PCN4_9ACTN